jgi:SAM-dependent methyltransferase
MSKYYPGNDYAFLGKGFIGKLLYKKKPNAPLKSLSRLSLNKDTKILDVGCGAGSVLYYLNGLGFNNLMGIDPFIAKDIDYGNGLKIIKQEINEVDGQWDLVMFHHSFEHVSYPLETMQSASRLLTPNGTIVIRIPTVSSYAWKHYKVFWVQLDAPRHFYLHSIESMKILADHSGLNLHEVIYDSSGFQFWGSEQYVKGLPFRDKRSYAVNPRGSIFLKADISAFNIRAHELNEVKQGDQAIFLLRKT